MSNQMKTCSILSCEGSVWYTTYKYLASKHQYQIQKVSGSVILYCLTSLHKNVGYTRVSFWTNKTVCQTHCPLTTTHKNFVRFNYGPTDTGCLSSSCRYFFFYVYCFGNRTYLKHETYLDCRSVL